MAEKRIVDIGPLLEDLKNELEDLKGATEVLTVEEAAEDEIEELKKLLVIDPQKMIPAWRDPDKDPPKVETEVLVLYRCNGYLGITTAHYENGNVFSEDSECTGRPGSPGLHGPGPDLGIHARQRLCLAHYRVEDV